MQTQKAIDYEKPTLGQIVEEMNKELANGHTIAKQTFFQRAKQVCGIVTYNIAPVALQPSLSRALDTSPPQVDA